MVGRGKQVRWGSSGRLALWLHKEVGEKREL